MYGSIPATVFRDGTPQQLSDEQEGLKREIYERMNPRRRKFVDRIGYENWDPFQKPNEPLDMRTRCVQAHHAAAGQRISERRGQKRAVWQGLQQGATECALGVVNKDEKYMGIFDFCRWYYDLLKKEGHIA